MEEADITDPEPLPVTTTAKIKRRQTGWIKQELHFSEVENSYHSSADP
jgi:hypothetical protein